MSVSAEGVRQSLAASDFGERLLAVNQLRQLDRKIAFELVQIAIADPNARIRYAAVSQLSHLGEENRDLSLSILRNCLLNDSETDVQAAAADALAGLKLTAAYEDIQRIYETTFDWLLQFSILAALGELGDPRAFDLLAPVLNSDQDLLKLAAIGSLGELGDPRAVSLLAPFTDDPDWQVRQRVAQALQLLGGEEAQSLLVRLVHDQVPQVAAAARAELSA